MGIMHKFIGRINLLIPGHTFVSDTEVNYDIADNQWLSLM